MFVYIGISMGPSFWNFENTSEINPSIINVA
jgi:hypothetical protein